MLGGALLAVRLLALLAGNGAKVPHRHCLQQGRRAAAARAGWDFRLPAAELSLLPLLSLRIPVV